IDYKAGKSGMMNQMTLIQPGIDEIRVGYQISDQDNKGGFVLIIVMPLLFVIIAIFASLKVVEYNTAVFLSGYRTSLLMTCMLCAINLANTGSAKVPGNFECTLSTNPMWSDLSSMTDNQTLFDCDIPHRIYGLTKSFRGLEALIGIFTQACAELIAKVDPYTQITIITSSIQQMGSLLIYDLKGGCAQYRLAMIDEQTKTTQMLQYLLIIFFILALSFTIIGFILIITTRNILFEVAESSTKFTELDPETDASERTGMGASAWKEQYSCDCLRIDKQHQHVLLYLACLCGSLDSQMNINEQIDTLMNSEEGINSVDTQNILQNYHSICMERTQQNQGIVGSQLSLGEGTDNDHINKNLNVTTIMSKTQLKELVKKQLAIAAILFRTTFATFIDEEYLIIKYKIPHLHKKAHYIYHATIIRKIQTLMLSIASSSRNKEGPALIPSSYAQSLIRLYSSWLTDHVAKMDRELATLLVGKAPESELERDIPVPNELKVPHSYSQFLDSDNASLQDKTLFNKLVRVLKLKLHSTS
ncbi:MAG: hypothetical protein EZS28_018092, partial [Streblomastix strix]